MGSIPAALETSTLPKKFRFRYTNIMSVKEAPEPSEILYENAHFTLKMRGAAFVRVL